MSSITVSPSNPQYSTHGPWSAYAGAWGADSLTYGTDYTQSITFDSTTFPNNVLFSWSFPLYGGPDGVWSYPCIIYGSTPELTNSAVPSAQVSALNLSVTYSAELNANSGQLDTIFDIWLTSKPYGDMSTVKYELEIIPQTDWHYSGYAYSFSDSTLQNASVYVNPNWGGNAWTNIVVEPSSEMLTGTISISDILKNLIWNGVITGQEYISGVEFGPEPGSGSGTLHIDSMSYQWAGTAAVHLAAGDNSLQVTTPGGNSIVGNGAVDTIIYNAAYSQFQIKTSGSETLVTENNNISTLDYLQAITFVEFSDGVYDTRSGTFASARPIQTNTGSLGSTTLTAIGSNFFLYANDDATVAVSGVNGAPLVSVLSVNGAPVVANALNGWAPIGAIRVAGGYEVAFELSGGNLFTWWACDSNGNYISDTAGAVAPTSVALESLETTFGQDLNGDGTIGLTTNIIATDTTTYGSTSLVLLGSTYSLFAAGTSSGPVLQVAGAAVTAASIGGWTPIGAVRTANGYEVAFKLPGSNLFTIWNTDSNGKYLSDTIGAVTATSAALEVAETTFGQDLNGDGAIGLRATVIATDTTTYGSTSLASLGSTYSLFAAGTSSGPALQVAGVTVTAASIGGWTPIGAARTASGYEVAFKLPGSNLFTIWNTDSNGNYVSDTIGAVTATSAALEVAETTFGQDLNGDGTVGLMATIIATVTTTYGSTSLVSIGTNYSLFAAGTSSGPALQVAGIAVTAASMGGWTPIGAARTANGYEVAFKLPGSNLFTIWNTDSNGNYVSDTVGAVSATSSVLTAAETLFHQDFNGNGVIGSVVGSASQTAATIAAGGTVEIAAASATSMTFAASTGLLMLDQPSAFSGEIYGFTGDGTLAGSDQIDLVGINFNTVSDSYANGALTVTDGNNTAILNFSGAYVLGNFKFASDGNGGTIVYDPPVSGSKPAAPAVAPANVGHTVFDLHPEFAQLVGDHHLSNVPSSDDHVAFAGAAVLPMMHAVFENATPGFSGQNPMAFHDSALTQAPHAHFHS
jgi:hypothetical protein